MEMTALEWFAEQMITKGKLTPELFEQAKEMEKQQIVKAAASAYEDMFGTDGTEYGQKYYEKLTQEP
jgi:hypothetical protein